MTDLTKFLKPLDNQHESRAQVDPAIALPKNAGQFKWVVVGQIGTGKSTLLLNVLDYYKRYYNHIYMFSQSAEKDDKWAPLLEELKPENKFYTALTDKNMTEMMDAMGAANLKAKKKAEKAKKPPPKLHNLCIFDDVLSDIPDARIKGPFNSFMLTHRHYGADVWITAQKYSRLNSNVRSNFQIITLYPTNNRTEYNKYLEELNVKPEEFERHFQAMSDDPDPRAFITINFLSKRPRFFNKFSLINERSNPTPILANVGCLPNRPKDGNVASEKPIVKK